MSNLADELDDIAQAITNDKDGRHVTAADAATIRRAAEALRWVSVEERLPSHGDSVLAWNGYVVHQVTVYRRMSGSVLPADVTHWMPLPEEPK